MTGRGKPRKAKSPDKSKHGQEDMKTATVPKSLKKDVSEARMNGHAKDEKPKERKMEKQSGGKPTVMTTQTKTTKHQTTTTDETEVPVQATRPKTQAGIVKQKSADGLKKTKSDSTQDTKDGLRNETINAAMAGRANLPKQSPKEIVNMQEALKDSKNDLIKVTKAKPCGGKVKSQESLEEKKRQQDAPKDTKNGSIKTTNAGLEALEDTKKDCTKVKTLQTKACLPQHKCEDKSGVDTILMKTLGKLKIKRQERSDTSEVVNELVDGIIKHLKENTVCFKDVEKPLHTGSYYENLKISNPDEFDVMLPIPVCQVTVEPFGEDGAFYSVELRARNHPLQKFQESNTLPASKMLDEFREEVKKCAKKYPGWVMTRKKRGCPAVTLTTEVKSVTISLDVVLSIVVKSTWPDFTKDGLQIQGWLGRKVRRDYRFEPYYLVPKYEGKGDVENNGVPAKDTWRISFSHIEKGILKNHGSEKTCCEENGARCCRKDCLKLLKHLLSLLKEENSSFDKFCSYHAKTTLLHACCSRTKDTEWRASDLGQCFRLLLDDFVGHLEKRVLPNFFIPSQNLLSGLSQKKCKDLACCIKDQCEKGFPIFK